MNEPVRKLSVWRLMIALAAMGIAVSGGVLGFRQLQAARYAAVHKPWFAPYVDVTATPSFNFEQLGSTQTKDVILSFIVSSPSDACTPTWGSAYTLDKASDMLDLDRRIARLKQQEGNVAVSFGGLNNNELAVGCSDGTKLKKAYAEVVDRYGIDTIDLDLEQSGLTASGAAERRATAVAALQQERRKSGKPLAVWVTLPVTPQGLSEDGTTAVAQLLAKGVDIAGVNVMTMDYGQSRPADQSMLKATESALTQTQRQLSILYDRANIHLTGATVWAKLGATPMIGQNDDKDEIFSLDDAKKLNDFSHSHQMGRMSMWSANRDIECGANYVYTSVVSDACSGVTQNKFAFMTALSNGFTGTISSNAAIVTKAEKESSDALKSDDPASSPYQIWSASGAYLEGTKVVWHHNVYQAKWWTQGDVPDNPVLQTWQTPWELVGPVLPGEKPVPQATLPPGTYPDWDGKSAYDAGQRVLFHGVPYQAKWWNLGESPAAASSNPDSSPWVPLTQSQINAITSLQTKN